jgi:hypothetical protein
MNQSLRIRYRNTTAYVSVGLVGLLIYLSGLCLCVLQRNSAEPIGFLMLATWLVLSSVYFFWMMISAWRHAIEANAEGIIWQGAIRCKRILWSRVEVASWKDGLLTIRGCGVEIRMNGKYYNEDEMALLVQTISRALPTSVKMETENGTGSILEK